MAKSNIYNDDIKRNVSRKRKMAKNFERGKDIMERLDLHYGVYRNDTDIEKYCINYDLYNGRLDVALYDDETCIKMGNEKVKFSHGTPTHYPVIAQIANAQYGEVIARPFKPQAVHLGSNAKSLKLKKRNGLIKEILQNEVIQPLRASIERQLIQELQTQDPSLITLELLQQVEQRIAAETQSQTPQEVLDFIDNDYQTPTQRQFQQLLNYFIRRNDIKEIQQEGAKHAIITGKEVYYIGDEHGEPIMKLTNPKYFTWSGSRDTEWVQDGDWCKYEEWLSVEKATQELSEEISKKDLKELNDFAEPMGGWRHLGKPGDGVMEQVMHTIAIDEDRIIKNYGHVDIKTKAGMDKMQHIYADAIGRYGNEYGDHRSAYGVRKVHFCWRDKRKMYRVTRMIDGKERKFWMDEHYTTIHEDIEVKEVWVDEVWEGTKYGTSNPIYANIRPVPAQYKSIYDPFCSKLPYVGKCYNTHMNNAKNIAPIDLGKPWQKEFDTLMAQIKHDLATDFGKVFIMLMSLKPDNMKWQDWMDTMRNAKLLMAQPKKHGLSGIDPQILRGIDLSRTSDIAGKVQMLEVIRNNLIQAMFFNQGRVGAIGQYATTQNIQQNAVASYNQTEGFFETHRQIVEKALNMFMNRAKYLYKNKDWKLEEILDDVSRVDLLLGSDFWYEELNVKVSTSTEDVRKVEQYRSNMLTFAQNGMSFEGILGLTMADTTSEIADVMRRESKKAEQAQAEAAANAQKLQEQKIQAESAEKKEERNFKMLIEQLKAQTSRERAVIQAAQWREANDVDANRTPDSVQRELVKQEYETRRHDDKMEVEMAKIKAKVKSRLQ